MNDELLHDAVERRRLLALHKSGLLDTPPDERWDRITRLVALMFDAPIVLLSLVDDRRAWIKSSIGLAVSEVPRQGSFCAHVMQQDEITVVCDAREDSRFIVNHLVANGAEIRFHAGVPLVSRDGTRFGALCLHDVKPRHDFKQEQRAQLTRLAEFVALEIEAHPWSRPTSAWRQGLCSGLTGSLALGAGLLALHGPEIAQWLVCLVLSVFVAGLTWQSTRPAHGRTRPAAYDADPALPADRSAVQSDGKLILGELCASIREQVKAAISATEHAAASVLDQAQDVDANANKFSDLARMTEPNPNTSLNGSGKGVSHDGFILRLREYLAQSAAAADADRQSFERMVLEAKAVEELAADITSIAARTEMLATNGALAATGSVVVLDEVRGLARQVSNAADSVQAKLQQFARNIRAISDERTPQEHNTAERQLLHDLSSQLSALVAGYQNVVDCHRGLLTEIQALGSNIGDAVMTMIGALQFQDIVRQRLECVLHCVEALARDNDPASALEALRQNNRFASAQAVNGPSQPAMIELF